VAAASLAISASLAIRVIIGVSSRSVDGTLIGPRSVSNPAVSVPSAFGIRLILDPRCES